MNSLNRSLLSNSNINSSNQLPKLTLATNNHLLTLLLSKSALSSTFSSVALTLLSRNSKLVAWFTTWDAIRISDTNRCSWRSSFKGRIRSCLIWRIFMVRCERGWSWIVLAVGSDYTCVNVCFNRWCELLIDACLYMVIYQSNISINTMK